MKKNVKWEIREIKNSTDYLTVSISIDVQKSKQGTVDLSIYKKLEREHEELKKRGSR